MKTRDRIALVALALLVLVIPLVVRVARRKAAAPQSSRATSPVAASTKRSHGSTWHRAYTGPIGPTTNFLGQTVSVTTVPYLVSAVKTAKRIAEEAVKFDPKSHGYQALKGLERKLFMDDYAYAALVAGSGMNRTNWEAVFEKLDQQAAPETNAPLPVISEAATDLANYYGGIVEWGHTGAYSNIVSALGKYTDQNPLETDLFKDAAVYASLRDTTDGWIKQGQHDTEKWLAANSQRFATGAVSKPNYVTGYLAIQANEESDLTHLQEAYQNVFSYRLAERDGLTDPALVTDLDRIVLTNSGPELVIPIASKW